jgi:hypothetical protein
VPPSGAGDVAVDDQHVYWTNSPGLGRAKLNGYRVKLHWIPGHGDECKLDKHGWKRCGASYEVEHLEPGDHKLLARASDEFGNTDRRPAKRRWTVR